MQAGFLDHLTTTLTQIEGDGLFYLCQSLVILLLVEVDVAQELVPHRGRVIKREVSFRRC